MARLRRRGRRNPSKIAAAVLGVGCVALAGFYLWPDGSPADATPGVAPAADVKGSTLGALAQPLITSTPQPNGAATARPTVAVAPPATRPAEGEKAQLASNATPPAPVRTAAPAAGFLDAAKRLQDAGKLLDARDVLNNALQSGTLDPATADAVKDRMRDLNQTVVFTPSKRYEADPQQSTYTVQSGDQLTKICSKLDVPYGFIARVNAVAPNKIRVGQSLKLIQGPVHCVVSKSRFTLDCYLGNLPGRPGSMYLTTYKVGLGESSSTPTGTWEVMPNSKTVNPAWTNPRTNEVFGRDDPNNPLGERWIGLTGIAGDAVGAVSYGIHGTIHPESIGTNASMGCVRLKADDIAEVFDMLSEGKSTVLVVAD